MGLDMYAYTIKKEIVGDEQAQEAMSQDEIDEVKEFVAKSRNAIKRGLAVIYTSWW